MRKRVRAIMIIVAAAFIAGFLLGEIWSFVGRRARGPHGGPKPGVVGQVGSIEIRAEEYARARENATRQYQADSLFRELTAEDQERVDRMAWEKLTGEYVWDRVLKSAKLRVTDEELNRQLFVHPPEWALRHPDLQTDGMFDTAKYVQALQNPQLQQYFIQYYFSLRDQLRQLKTQVYAYSAYRPSNAEVQEALTGANSVWTVTSLFIGRAAVGEQLGGFNPTDAEVDAWYKKNGDEFRSAKEFRELRYAVIPVQVTGRDSMAARQRIDAAHARLVGADTASLRDSIDMAMYSDGDFQPETTSMPVPRAAADSALLRALATTRPGKFTAPVPAVAGWQIAVFDSLKADTFWLRRIRTRIKQENAAEIEVGDQARSFISDAQTGDFDSVALARGLSVNPTPLVLVGGKVTRPQVALYSFGQLEYWASRAKKGDVMESPMRGPGALYVFKLAEVTPAGLRPLDERLKPYVRERMRQEKEKELWLAMARDAAAQIRAGTTTIEGYAASHPQAQVATDVVNGVFDYVARSNKSVEFVGALLALEPGQTTGPVEGRAGAWIIRCDSREEKQVMQSEQYFEQRNRQLAQTLAQDLWQRFEVQDFRLPRGY